MNVRSVKDGCLRPMPVDPAQEQQIRCCLLGLISHLAEVVARELIRAADRNDGALGDNPKLPAANGQLTARKVSTVK